MTTTSTTSTRAGGNGAAVPAAARRGSRRDTTLAYAVGALRTGIGAGLLVAPGFAGRVWVGPHADGPGARLFARVIGARDVALGVQTLRAARAGVGTVRWLRLGVVADGADAAATVLAARNLTPLRRWAMPLVASAVAAMGAVVTEETAEHAPPAAG